MAHRELERVHFFIIMALESFILARKESCAARVCRTPKSMLDIPAWPVRQKVNYSGFEKFQSQQVMYEI